MPPATRVAAGWANPRSPPATCLPERPAPPAREKRSPRLQNTRPGRNRRSGSTPAAVQVCSMTRPQPDIRSGKCRERQSRAQGTYSTTERGQPCPRVFESALKPRGQGCPRSCYRRFANPPCAPAGGRTWWGPLFLRGRRGNRIAPGHVFDEIVRRAVFSRPLRLGVLGPGVFAVLAEEFLVNDPNDAGQPHQVRQQEFSRELGILNARGAALRTTDGLAQHAVDQIPFPHQAPGALKVLPSNFKADAGEGLGDEPRPFIFGFVANLGMNAGLFEFLFEGLSLGWLVESSNGNHVHKAILHVSPPNAITAIASGQLSVVSGQRLLVVAGRWSVVLWRVMGWLWRQLTT